MADAQHIEIEINQALIEEIKRLRAALDGVIDVARSDLSRDLLPTAIETIARRALKDER
jgi:hypothetical protein